MKSKDQLLLEEAYQSILEQVGGNYLYHSTEDTETAKQILNSGHFKASNTNQTATDAQTDLPTVSFGRSLRYQIDGSNVNRDYQVVFVVDRPALENKYKTLATSQSPETRGSTFPHVSKISQHVFNRNRYDINKDNKLDDDELAKAPEHIQKYFKKFQASKSGGEFEEAVPTKTGKIPWKGMLIGFYLVPGKEAAEDEELLNHPLRLEMSRPNVFVKANP